MTTWEWPAVLLVALAGVLLGLLMTFGVLRLMRWSIHRSVRREHQRRYEYRPTRQAARRG